MIDRYTLPEMGKIWSDENRYQQMLQVEIYACEAMRDLGLISREAFEDIVNNATFDLNRIYELNETTRHDLVSFLTSVNEHVKPESALYIQKGMTASDVLDTSLSVQMVQSLEILIGKFNTLAEEVKKKAIKYKYTLMIGRTHGMHAEPITFGLKMALWYEDIARCTEHLFQAKNTIAVGMVSGSVGNFANINPVIEEHVCRRLGLKPARLTNQIIQRDRHAFFVSTLAITGSVLDKFATEIRNLQRTEIGELQEGVVQGQTESSTMPHKRNPVLCERISGLARVLRGNVNAAMEDIVLWHERDLTHSSVERIIIPDSCILLDQMLHLMQDVLSNLEVKEEQMMANMENDLGLIFSQRIFLSLLDKGIPRNTAYQWLKRNADVSYRDKIDFEYLVMQDTNIMAVLTKDELFNLFNYDYYTKNIEYIYSRTGIELPE